MAKQQLIAKGSFYFAPPGGVFTSPKPVPLAASGPEPRKRGVKLINVKTVVDKSALEEMAAAAIGDSPSAASENKQTVESHVTTDAEVATSGRPVRAVGAAGDSAKAATATCGEVKKEPIVRKKVIPGNTGQVKLNPPVIMPGTKDLPRPNDIVSIFRAQSLTRLMVLLQYDSGAVFRVAPYSVVKRLFPDVVLAFYEKFLVVDENYTRENEASLDISGPADIPETNNPEADNPKVDNSEAEKPDDPIAVAEPDNPGNLEVKTEEKTQDTETTEEKCKEIGGNE